MSGLLISAQPSTPTARAGQGHLAEAHASGPFSSCRLKRAPIRCRARWALPPLALCLSAVQRAASHAWYTRVRLNSRS